MKYLVVILGLCLLFAGLRADSSESSESSDSNIDAVEEPAGTTPCSCQHIQDPVCGKFVVEYANACERNCAGALPAAPSECGLEENPGNFLPPLEEMNHIYNKPNLFRCRGERIW